MATDEPTTEELLEEMGGPIGPGDAPMVDEPLEVTFERASARMEIPRAVRAAEHVAELAIEELLNRDRPIPDGGTVKRSESIACDDCGDFSIEKSYAGATGTEGERHYEESVEVPDECPACGGQLVAMDGGSEGGGRR